MNIILLQNTSYFLPYCSNEIWTQGRAFIQQFGIVSAQIGCLQLDQNHSRISFGQHPNSPTSQQANILIAFKYNGSGIPAHIKDKIFQPFFTTKPTGQRTRLGLSLSYDIVKAYSGELILDSNEGVGTEFTIKTPIA
jgi:signal transduction histidine kinase